MAPNKKQIILDTALALFISQGISDTSTASIAKTAQVATGTLFHHFPNKQALVDELYRSVKQELAEYLQHQLQPELRAPSGTIFSGSDITADKDLLIEQGKSFWLNALQWFVCHPEKLAYLKLYYASPLVSPDARSQALEEIFSFLFELIHQGQALGLFQHLPSDFLVRFIESSMFNTASYITEKPEQDNDEMRLHSFLMVLQAISLSPPINKPD